MKTDQTVIKHELRQNGFRWTKPRKRVFGIFRKSSGPLTVARVFASLEKQNKDMDLASVYRSIKLFCRQGILVAVDSVAEGKRYELSERFLPHHHHLVCRVCGRTEELEDCLISQIEARAAQTKKFKIESHDLTLTGVCAACQKQG